ncbi:MAG: hypothetical protein KDC74_06350 [Flavobacteriaceae bacterium]|nr:hypothetical protein [Flavobacteriaceae bacterium]MCB0485264.1 hypothetical protein [Flavobacteriaceae bacterium]
MKKFIILFSLFILPLVFYIFLLTGTNNFAKLPVVTEKVSDVTVLQSRSDSLTLANKISIICFLGDDMLRSKNNAYNLNEKIYKHFYQFPDFQTIAIVPNGTEDKVKELKEEIGFTTDMSKWNFVFTDISKMNTFFDGLKTPYGLDSKGYTPYAFIVDKDQNLRGRTNDEDMPNGLLYGYDAEKVSNIHSKMVDDVKVLLAEYRLALKKNTREI